MHQRIRSRFGIGEWYGRLLVDLPVQDRTELARIQELAKNDRPAQPCPFKGGDCTKDGGVCSLRQYEQDPITQIVRPSPGPEGGLVTTCPNRFRQDNVIFRWIGQTLLGTEAPLVVGEVGFLEQPEGADDVGRIDNVLVHPDADPFRWCALEIQAVYFSGTAMSRDFQALGQAPQGQIPLPAGNRRPDYRSSGPKRLMPQLQIKIPALRRWGKKMAVVVDRKFFDALGPMDDVRDISNCDIAWFVLTYDEVDGRGILREDFTRLTTLERAVEGLTGGLPVSLGTFEDRIREKLGRNL